MYELFTTTLPLDIKNVLGKFVAFLSTPIASDLYGQLQPYIYYVQHYPLDGRLLPGCHHFTMKDHPKLVSVATRKHLRVKPCWGCNVIRTYSSIECTGNISLLDVWTSLNRHVPLSQVKYSITRAFKPCFFQYKYLQCKGV